MTQFGFVLGNGKTRAQVNPVRLRHHGLLYVCNRACEEMEYDYCIAVDKKISRELQDKKYTIYTRTQNCFNQYSLPLQHNSGWSSGPAAAGMAVLNGHPYIFLIGMDLISDTDTINNLYADTPHYKSSSSTATPYVNWISQIQTLIKKHYHQRFIHVNPLLGFSPDAWQKYDNFTTMTLHEFNTMINNTVDL